jgi:hypothetical protein
VALGELADLLEGVSFGASVYLQDKADIEAWQRGFAE